MPKWGVNPKKIEAKLRKEQKEKQGHRLERQRQENEYWKETDKNILAQQQRQKEQKQKQKEAQKKREEVKKLQLEEEKELNQISKPKQVKQRGKKAQVNLLNTMINNINSQQTQNEEEVKTVKLETHPEKRQNRQYNIYLEKMLPKYRKEFPRLNRQQLLEKIWSAWKHADENPKNNPNVPRHNTVVPDNILIGNQLNAQQSIQMQSQIFSYTQINCYNDVKRVKQKAQFPKVRSASFSQNSNSKKLKKDETYKDKFIQLLTSMKKKVQRKAQSNNNSPFRTLKELEGTQPSNNYIAKMHNRILCMAQQFNRIEFEKQEKQMNLKHLKDQFKFLSLTQVDTQPSEKKLALMRRQVRKIWEKIKSEISYKKILLHMYFIRKKNLIAVINPVNNLRDNVYGLRHKEKVINGNFSRYQIDLTNQKAEAKRALSYLKDQQRMHKNQIVNLLGNVQNEYELEYNIKLLNSNKKILKQKQTKIRQYRKQEKMIVKAANQLRIINQQENQLQTLKGLNKKFDKIRKQVTLTTIYDVLPYWYEIKQVRSFLVEQIQLLMVRLNNLQIIEQEQGIQLQKFKLLNPMHNTHKFQGLSKNLNLREKRIIKGNNQLQKLEVLISQVFNCIADIVNRFPTQKVKVDVRSTTIVQLLYYWESKILEIIGQISN